MGRYCYIWEFHVRQDSLAAFESAYGPDGDWAQFFRRDPEYIRTDLLQDYEVQGRYLTTDHWKSREACYSFRERYRSEFESLDADCAQFTLKERCIGEFDLIG